MTATLLRPTDQTVATARSARRPLAAASRLLPGRLVAYAWLLAGPPIAVLQADHAHLRELHELPPVLHWFRDTALAVPVAAAAAAVAVLVVTWLRPDDPGGRASLVSVALWGLVSAALFAVLAVPLAQVHAVAFGAEAEIGISPVAHALDEGLTTFQVALAVVPAALLAGVPWRAARRAAAIPVVDPERPHAPTVEQGSIQVGGVR